MCSLMTCAYVSHALDRYVSELSYIHTKLMIVDDRRVIVRIPSFIFLNIAMTFFVHKMGSANLNDRSQKVRDPKFQLMIGVWLIRDCKGDGDSEIALVVEDQDSIPSTMDGRPYRAARFAATLRRRLFRRAYSLSYEIEITSRCGVWHVL